MLTKAVMPQLDAIVQKAESIVLVGSKKEHLGSHLRQAFLRSMALSPTRSACAEKVPPQFIFGKMIRNKVRGMGLN